MIRLVCVGKLKEKFYKEAEREYIKRISSLVKFEVREVDFLKDEKCDYSIYLDENGTEMDSISFSNFLKKIMMDKKNICFFIGGWGGLEEEQIKKADFVLSLSKMTFPYQLCRIILLEQIYRGLALMKGIDYHK
ncbi:MAG: 23S rRNA (pseudouridine(1915)-N(3))-methyltransferase RlmH [Thermoplasmata archaeon]|nr:23S rRNA (pseudouridine(1915)-N(3))-methyltransferase RlmH [Thermoplasmata archaeon]